MWELLGIEFHHRHRFELSEARLLWRFDLSPSSASGQMTDIRDVSTRHLAAQVVTLRMSKVIYGGRVRGGGAIDGHPQT